VTAYGPTVGVEEEYQLVDAQTWQLADAPQVVADARALLGEGAQGEIMTSQLEVATRVCGSLDDLRAQLGRLRRGAAAAAAASGCRVLAAGTHPTATWSDQRLADGRRYLELYSRMRLLALQQMITGCHVHVQVEPDLVVPVLDRLRPDLPVLLALSGSSPFWEGTDSGYASYRTQWFARWPVTGSPEVLRTRAAYDALVRDLVASGMVEDARHLYWDARPSLRFPTVEVRVADTMPLLDDVVLHAALARSLVRVACAQALAGAAYPEPRPEAVRAARWRAARFGLEGELFDLRSRELRRPAQVVGELLARLREDLETAGEWEQVSALASAALARGTSAARQRRVLERTGDLHAVVRSVVEESGA
jgi:YbdK family carboxylate-amine ligase